MRLEGDRRRVLGRGWATGGLSEGFEALCGPAVAPTYPRLRPLLSMAPDEATSSGGLGILLLALEACEPVEGADDLGLTFSPVGLDLGSVGR